METSYNMWLYFKRIYNASLFLTNIYAKKWNKHVKLPLDFLLVEGDFFQRKDLAVVVFGSLPQ